MSKTLQYVLQENLLTSATDDYNGRPVNAKSYSQEELIDLVASESTTVAKSDLLAALNSYNEHAKTVIANGGALNTPLLNTSFSISGVFNGADDSFDAARHTLRLNVQPGSALREAVKSVTLEKVRGSETTPWIQSVADKLADDATANFEITAGSVIQLKGSRLKYDDSDTEQGVFLIPTGDGDTVRLGKAVMLKPAMIIVPVPSTVPTGEYELELRTRMQTGSGRELKTLKKGRFLRTLSVIS